jgi:hypothetical protein
MEQPIQSLLKCTPDFALFTPFTSSEAESLLGISAIEYSMAMREGALCSSITIPNDPLCRLSFHSFWDLIEFSIRRSFGWPTVSVSAVASLVADICDELDFSISSSCDITPEFREAQGNTLSDIEGFGGFLVEVIKYLAVRDFPVERIRGNLNQILTAISMLITHHGVAP